MEEVNKNAELENADKKLHISDVSDSYISVNEFELAYNFLMDNMDSDKRAYIRKVLFCNDESIIRIIRKYRECK